MLLTTITNTKNTTQENKYEPEDIIIDWVQKGAVTPTQDQGSCGSCWAFAAVGGLQGLRYVEEGILENLSVQQLVSCIPKEYLDPGAIDGCGGSYAHFAYQYTNQHGIETFENCPYVSGKKGVVPKCRHQDEDSVFFNNGEDKGYVQIQRGDLQGMKKAIQKQPLSIAVAAGSHAFQFYKKGILKSKNCGEEVDHAIMLVGMYDYGRWPYWVVQNSWGAKGWGQNGFGKILISEGDGVCGINVLAEYPTVQK